MNERNSERELLDLCKSLSLRFEEQDWGIVNASSQRLREFIDFYLGHPVFSSVQKQHLAELIIASANDAMEEGRITEGELKHFQAFMDVCRVDTPLQLRYWTRLRSSAADPFPVAELLRKWYGEL